MIHVYCVSHVDSLVNPLSLSLSLSSGSRDIMIITYNIKWMNAQHVKYYNHLAVFVCLIWVFGDNLSFPTEESFFIRRLMLINIHIYFFLDRKQKLRLHVTYIHCIYQAGWIYVCFDQINEVSKYCCLFFLLIYISIRFH